MLVLPRQDDFFLSSNVHAAGARVPTIVPSSIALTNSIGTPRAESGTHNPHEVLQRLREDHVVWLYSIVAARLGSQPRVLAGGPVVDPLGKNEAARGFCTAPPQDYPDARIGT